ncbi:hypothetical protein GLOIN_2v1769408 [Rhizophagus irregularis DAOM 181602=DAOM 197198]|uniref:Uncharacterized protein n=2 Tax=Rhizophagus irregularis TaxID=588596 RepID=A0A2P4QEU9_RHIID|nr:hypothetical protein GLOIN_2v1769408 [Rhizophagus irregularis DAOM 181602=DAOM 197198]POG76158.1 hypothetical protein GLOIN_2v1769408 [Rhizophagus irregularis DAOM 181602=DAOM 197198]GBC19617.2 hypothetical protein GLOIN_2v1769408 [Rhizophagus irregularis DAOM 181602=DAOM 197198]|eukprot:XP_025183024.1 hypothetical protein GLOIN_2v1769408 [Rhizophagus irregularis DAOM 181602=DAOM 197198]
MIADLSDKQITITAGLTDILQTTMASLFEIILLRKRKDKESTKSKEEKKVKLTPADNPKEKDTIEILLEDHYEVQQFLEMIPANALKNGLVVLKKMKQKRFEDNPYIFQRLLADSDNSNNNTTIGIKLLYKEKITGMEFDGSKINGAIPFVRNIDDDNNFNLRINSISDKIDGSNMSSLIEDMLVVLDEIKSENEITELTRQRNARKYAYFYELYKMILETVASEPKKFGEINALKAKKKLEGRRKKQKKKLN